MPSPSVVAGANRCVGLFRLDRAAQQQQHSDIIRGALYQVRSGKPFFYGLEKCEAFLWRPCVAVGRVGCCCHGRALCHVSNACVYFLSFVPAVATGGGVMLIPEGSACSQRVVFDFTPEPGDEMRQMLVRFEDVVPVTDLPTVCVESGHAEDQDDGSVHDGDDDS
jgi:hypothetical protein